MTFPRGTPIIEFRNVRVQFGDLVVHKNVSLDIRSGEVVTLLGPSGTGKTVLLKLMVGLFPPTSGSIKVIGQEITMLEEEVLREIRTHIGMLFQGAALFDSLSVYDNVAFALREQKVDEDTVKSRVLEKLSLVNLPDLGEKFPPELSGGQRKRVGLARALATEPDLLLFDEPTTGLDPTSKGIIDELIIELREHYKIASIVVTHDVESARKISDRLIMVSDGEIVVDGDASKLWDHHEAIMSFTKGTWGLVR